MSLRLSIPEFGGMTGAIVNSGFTDQTDASWYVDFTSLPAVVSFSFSCIELSDQFLSSGPLLKLWYSTSPLSTIGATLLAELLFPLAGTSGRFIGQNAEGTFTNPGAKGYLILTSANGSA